MNIHRLTMAVSRILAQGQFSREELNYPKYTELKRNEKLEDGTLLPKREGGRYRRGII